MMTEPSSAPEAEGNAAQTESTTAAGLHTSPQALTIPSTVTLVTPPPVDCDAQIEALHQSAARYRRLLDDQCDPICCFQADFKLTFVNHAYSALFGKPPTELIGHSLLELIPPESQPELIACLAALTPTTPVALSERPLQLNDGTLRWFEWTHRLLLDEHGQVVEYQGVGRDITARRQAETAAHEQHRLSEALRTSLAALTSTLHVEAVLQQILASVATVVPSQAGTIILMEGEQARVAQERGYTPDAAAYFRNYHFPHDMVQQIRALNQPYLIPDTQSWPDWGALAFGEWIRSSIGIPITLHGQTMGLLVLDSATPNYFQPTDVDKLQTFAHYAGLALANAYHVRWLEEKIAARTAELQAAKEQMEAILYNSPDAILLVAPDLHIQHTNALFTARFGAQGARSLLDLIHPADVPAITALVHAVVDQQPGQRLELRVYQLDGALVDVELSLGFVKADCLVCILHDITESKRAQRALAEERNLLRTVIDAIPATIYVKDLAHRFVLRNAAPIRMAPQFTAADLIGKSDVDYMPAVLAAKFWAEEEALFQTGQPLLNQEEELTGPDGSAIWLSTTKVPLRNQHGVITGLVGISHNITQRKVYEQQLRFYDSLQENVSDAIITTDLELQIQSWNRAAEIIYGWRADEVIGQNLREVLRSEYEAANGHEETIQSLMQMGFAQGEVTQCHRNGRRLSILRSVTLLKDERGRSIGLVSVGRDISERKEAERLLAEERNLLRTVIDAMPDVVFAKDRDHRFILRNNAPGHNGDVEPQSCLGKTDLDYFPPAAAAAFRAEEEAIFRTGQPLLGQELLVPRMDGIVEWALVTKVPLRNQQGEIIGLVGTISDITFRKEHERQLRFYASLQENVSDAVITTDLDLRIQSWNRAAETIYGWRAEEVMGKRSPEVLQTTYEATTSFDEVRQILFQQGFWQGEVMQRHRNGQWLSILRSTTLLKDEQGVPFGFVAVNRNITERKESERLLAEERNLLRTLIDAIPSAIYVKDRAHRFILRNAAPSHIVRDLDLSTVIGKTDFDYHSAALAAKFWAEEEALFQTGQPLLNQELQVVRTDGRVIWSATTKVPLRNLHGEIIGLVGIAYDLTAHKHALAALATSEEKYRHLIETMGSGFAIYDHHDHITYANERFCALLGYSLTELLGTSSYNYVDDTDAQTTMNQLARRFGGEHTTYELLVTYQYIVHKVSEKVSVDRSAH